MTSPAGQASDLDRKAGASVRDALADAAAVRAARERPMAERLEVALSMNSVVAELRAGVAAAVESHPHER